MNRFTIALVVMIVILRALWGLASLDRLDQDPDAYRMIAQTFSQSGVLGLSSPNGEVKPTAFRPPLYPMVLSTMTVNGKLSSQAVAIFHALLAGITSAAVYWIVQALWKGDARANMAAALAALLVAIDPLLLEQSRLVMTETLAAAIVSLVFVALGRIAPVQREYQSDNTNRSNTGTAKGLKSGLLVGVLLALAFFCRPIFVVWSACVVLGVWLHGRSSEPSGSSWPKWMADRSWITSMAIASTIAIAVAVWTLRNLQAVGHPFWATSHGGYTLLLGNNPMFYDYLNSSKRGELWDPESFFVAHQHRHLGDPTQQEFWRRDWSQVDADLVAASEPSVERRSSSSEADDDRLVYQAAIATIKQQPRTFLYACLVRLGRLWAPVPHQTGGRSSLLTSMVGVYYCVVFAAVGFGLWKHRTRSNHPIYWSAFALALSLSAVHTFYWSNIRMRAPLTPAIAVFAASVILTPRQTVAASSNAVGDSAGE